jgi:hypothetical protein
MKATGTQQKIIPHHLPFILHGALVGTAGSLWLPKDRVTLWITLMQKHLFMASFSIFWF